MRSRQIAEAISTRLRDVGRSRPAAWFRSLSIRQQVILGMAAGITFATLAFAFLILYTSRQALDQAKAERLKQSQRLALDIDKALQQSNNPLEDLPDLLSRYSISSGVQITMVDLNTRVIATSPQDESDASHNNILDELADDRRPKALLHRTEEGTHMVTFQPMQFVSGGLVVDYAKEDLLTLPARLLRIMPFFGLVILIIAMLSAWLHARYIVRPLLNLSKATANIASGKLDEPFVAARSDEIGRLSRSFDIMRVQLKAATDARLWWEHKLEQRVRERTEEVQNLVKRVITAQEEERRRLAQELHDDTAQALAAMLMGIEALRDSLPPDQERLQQHMDRTIAQGRRALEDLRRVILGLRPAAVEDLGAVVALRSYAMARLGPAGIRLDFVVHGKEQRLAPAVEAALFRILQEAVNNAAKHARAKTASIRFDFQDSRLVANVEDNGQGFDPLQINTTGRGMGLEGMRERAAIIGAKLDIISEPGHGAMVRVELPLKG